MRLTSELTDAAILAELGKRLELRRIDANLTQAQLAEQAGISKRTLERIESGNSADFVMIIRALRALGQVEGLESLIPDLPQSPLTLLKQHGRVRKRVYQPRSKSGRVAERTPPGPWKWGK
jgi:transcriptional regulator with XRE-family HTH domain